jgi:hypothetical protein
VTTVKDGSVASPLLLDATQPRGELAVHPTSDAEHAAWLADKIVALGDYAKEAAAMLRRWPDSASRPPCPVCGEAGCDCPRDVQAVVREMMEGKND